MPVTDFNTWNPVLYLEVLDGSIPSEVLRERTLGFTYVDRAREFDHIEWELNNYDGMLTRPEFLAAGMVVRMRLGYLNGATTWKAFIINRVHGGLGVASRADSPVGDGETRLIYEGRNRNAAGGKTSKRGRKAKAPAPPKSRAVSKKTGLPTGKGKQTFGSTSDITQYTSGRELLIGKKDLPHLIPCASTADAVAQIAARNGFEWPYALIEPTGDILTEIVIDEGLSDGQFLAQRAAAFGYIFKIEDDTLHWHTEHWSGARHVLADTLTYGAGPDILSMNMDCDFRLPMPKSVQVKGYNFRIRQGVVGSLDANKDMKKIELTINYSKFLEDPVKKEVLQRDVIVPRVLEHQIGADKKALQRYTTAHLNGFALSVRVVGNPKLLATRLLAIQGTGSIFGDGIWYISEARHIIKDTYTTELKLTHPPKTAMKQFLIKVGAIGDLNFNQKMKKIDIGLNYTQLSPMLQNELRPRR